MIRLPADQEEYLNERYTLTDLQNTINDGGSARYDRNGTNPWVYFKVLLLTLQFEKVKTLHHITLVVTVLLTHTHTLTLPPSLSLGHWLLVQV